MSDRLMQTCNTGSTQLSKYIYRCLQKVKELLINSELAGSVGINQNILPRCIKFLHTREKGSLLNLSILP